MPPLEILVAEDNLVNQEVARGLLGRRGHHVDIVGNGREAVEAVREHRYDVVLMDVHMPEMDGIEATREIRRLPGERGRVPIIALSASAMQDETDAVHGGGNDRAPAEADRPGGAGRRALALCRRGRGRFRTRATRGRLP